VRRAVEVGVQGPRLAEIRDNLAAGEPVVADPPPGLEGGRRVRVQDHASGDGALAAGGTAPTR
jgi:hypothetical protein